MIIRCVATGCFNVRSGSMSLFISQINMLSDNGGLSSLREPEWTGKAQWLFSIASNLLLGLHGAMLGLKFCARLKPDAIPTLFVSSMPTDIPLTSEGASSKRKSYTEGVVEPKKWQVAFERRERTRITPKSYNRNHTYLNLLLLVLSQPIRVLHEILVNSALPSSEIVSELLTNSTLCKDITGLSPHYIYHLFALKSFHSVIVHFPPKCLPFSYLWMKCRYSYFVSGFVLG